MENYNPARPWTGPKTRHHWFLSHRPHSYNRPAARLTLHRSRSVSFARDTPNRPNNRVSNSPIRPVNVNIMTPGCVMPPNIRPVRTPTPPRPASPPPYSAPSPMYHPDPTPNHVTFHSHGWRKLKKITQRIHRWS